ncbi:sterol desaturase family protein [Parvularcula sp. LCG005]|uniref:sterol desaturase family protein n=1 Tax=Parvularcula sp. LCG005 TaxID=3078805 RepID=UPI002941CE3A|nr:sterol desaturase family protein [Parvularcula sp. LCG005]WOI52017.1 sterol desaturase family protein [Parvularcula sp. LCG005]
MASFALTYIGLLGIILFRYVLVAGLFWKAVWGRPAHKVGGTQLAKAAPTGQTMWREARTSMAVSLIYALPAAILIESWKRGGTAIYEGVPGLVDWLWMPVSVLIYLVLHDAYFYWTHRMMHHPRLYKATHHTHHLSKQPTPWAAFAFSPWEAAISAPFIPLLAFIIPIHIGAFLFLLTLMTFNSVANHSGWEILPRRFLDGPVGRHLITARHHNLHHTRFKRNYGLYFRWWDHWMGTDDMSGDPMGRSAS